VLIHQKMVGPDEKDLFAPGVRMMRGVVKQADVITRSALVCR
jgi:hypothetical protein